MKKLLAALLLISASAQAATSDGVHRFYGYAFDLKTNEYLYTEVHSQKLRKGRWLGGSIAYYAADGSKLGLKTLDFSRDPYVPVYTLNLPLEGYLEGVTDNGNPIRMRKRAKTGAEIETGDIERDGDIAADSGFHSYLVAHMDDVLAGRSLHFKLVVAGYMDTVSFRVKKTGETTFDNRPAVVLEGKLDSALSLIAPELQFIYDPKTRQLLDYRGTSNIHDPRTGDAYEVHIVYTAKKPAGAPKKLPPLQ